MFQRKKYRRLWLPFIFYLCLTLSACGEDIGSSSSLGGLASGNSSSSDSSSSSFGSSNSSSSGNNSTSEKGSWNNSVKVLVPSADGTDVYSNDVSIIDASNTSEGYIMVTYTGTNEKVKLQVTCPDGVTYTYNLHGDYEVFPLTAGDGTYSVGIYESVNIEENKYAVSLSQDIQASITNPFGPYLYPNQYVNFTAASLPVAKAVELAQAANSDLDVVGNVYNYIIDQFTYDYDKAATVQSGYLPDVDEIFTINTGICFDYASVMATMLRSQGIPTRLEVGYKGEEYHAWISTYIENVGWVNGIIEFNGQSWRLMDPTFASTSNSPKKFITEDDDYLTKYVY